MHFKVDKINFISHFLQTLIIVQIILELKYEYYNLAFLLSVLWTMVILLFFAGCFYDFNISNNVEFSRHQTSKVHYVFMLVLLYEAFLMTLYFSTFYKIR